MSGMAILAMIPELIGVALVVGFGAGMIASIRSARLLGEARILFEEAVSPIVPLRQLRFSRMQQAVGQSL